MSAHRSQFEVVQPVDWLEHPRCALTDLVRQTGALDGAIARLDGSDLRIAASLQARFARRTVTASHSPAVARAIAGHEVAWLEPSAPESFYLPPHTQVLYVPFEASDGGRCAALLAYHARIEFSAADWRFLRSAFELPGTPPRAPSGALRLVA